MAALSRSIIRAFPVARTAGTVYRSVSTIAPSDGYGRQVGSEEKHHPLCDSLRGRVPLNIWNKTGKNLHVTSGHPLNTLRCAIEEVIEQKHPNLFTMRSDVNPIVTTKDCFDDLLVPTDHVSRQASDTYYISDDRLLRTHMTAHDPALLRGGVTAALTCGDVYRRDTIDRTHYPVFHQVDGYRLYDAGHHREEIEKDLKNTLEHLARHLFGPQVRARWTMASFPFTRPSFELEVWWNGDWLEVLGCGLLHRGVLDRAGVGSDVDGWAFGLGLERLAMVLFDIPDIRLFWSADERFLMQFARGDLTARFKPFSALPSVEKHVSFWIDDGDAFHENDFHQLVRVTCGDLVESVRVIDRFCKDGRVSVCFAVVFRSMERSLTHTEVNVLHDELRSRVGRILPVTLR